MSLAWTQTMAPQSLEKIDSALGNGFAPEGLESTRCGARLRHGVMPFSRVSNTTLPRAFPLTFVPLSPAGKERYR
jgi:hypothetical protein